MILWSVVLSWSLLNRYPFQVCTSFSTVLVRRYLGRTAVEEPLLGSLLAVEAIPATSASLWTVLLSTYTPSLLNFCFCCRLILFKRENKCECVCVCVCFFSDVLLCRLCSGEGCLGPDLNVRFDDVIVLQYQSPGVSLVSWSSKIGVDHCRSCQQGFCCSGLVYLPYTSSYSPF